METTALSVTILILIIGVISTPLPILPGPIIAFAGVFMHQLWMGDDRSVGWTFVGIAGALAMLSMIMDYVFTWWGAKKYGASWQGALGSIIGGIVGAIFFNLPGIILGPIVGAVLFELLNERTMQEAGRAGFGTIVGGILALVFKMASSVAIAVGFFFLMFFR